MLTILCGDAIEQLRTLPDESVQCCVTSPPYWGLRDYSTNGQLGLETTPEEYVARMVEIFREVRRVLRKDGTLWMNLGDCYASQGDRKHGGWNGDSYYAKDGSINPQRVIGEAMGAPMDLGKSGLKPKDLCGIPWRVAFALQADGWWLRSDMIWAKPNPMPESVTDRPTKSHEYLFLLTKGSSYFYDAEAIKEPKLDPEDDLRRIRKAANYNHNSDVGVARVDNWAPSESASFSSRNKRSVWTIATAPYPEAHFATYPPDLVKPCVLAGTSAKGCCAKCGAPWERIVERSGGTIGSGGWNPNELEDPRVARNRGKDLTDYKVETLGWQPTCKCKLGNGHMMDACTVLDPFAGSGTTGAVALELGRKAVLIELNPKYVALIRQRCDITPGLQLA